MADVAVPAAPSGPTLGTRGTAAQLRQQGLKVQSPSERFRDEILRLLEAFQKKGVDRPQALQALFPHTVLPTETFEDVVASVVSGAHLLFFGPSGTGKTSLAKDMWELYPKGAWVVSGCPVLDHPFSLTDLEVSARHPPCPTCRRRFSPGGEMAVFDPSRVDAAKIPAEFTRLREGYGFARLQGSSEVFPDHLTGNINLRKLEEIGDPMSPLVLEPGKLLQANRGVLLVDEIGKLPLGTQNVLLQALQEGTVTPAKSRETFPAEFVAVSTSNLSDLDNINDPLSDRLTSLHVGFNTHHRQNRQIVDLARPGPGDYVPEVLVDAGVRVIERWRLKMSEDNPDIGEVGSNRTLIDVVARTQAFSQLAERPFPSLEDLKEGLWHAMRGRIRARSGDSFQQNARRVREFLDHETDPALAQSSKVYWCRFFRNVLRENRGEAEALVGEGRRLLPDAGLQEQLAAGVASFPKFQLFVTHVAEREHPVEPATALSASLATFAILERFSLFACDAEGNDDVAA